MANFGTKYHALTIDTCIFIGTGMTIETGLFKQLDQFSKSPVKFVLSDIVHREVSKQLFEKTKEARSKVQNALKVAGTHLLSTEVQVEEASALLIRGETDSDIVERRLKSFIENTGAEIIESETHVDVSRLVRMYFSAEAPFENTGDKKNEFPDALALLSIENWAGENDFNILAVSTDKGWKRFSENSERIDVIESLGDAISVFQPIHIVHGIIGELEEMILSGENGEILEQIKDEIVKKLDKTGISFLATSVHNFEVDDLFTTYVKHEFLLDEFGIPEASVIRVEDDCIVVRLSVEVTCEVQGTFSLSVWDGTDREYISLPDTVVQVEASYMADILLTLTGDFKKNIADLDVDNIEVISSEINADFGDLEPDYSE